jgi:hypothetical protein
MNLVNYAQGFLYMYKAWKRSLGAVEFGSLSRLAVMNFEKAYDQMPNNCEILINCGDMLLGIFFNL